jgi:hypothetical protein
VARITSLSFPVIPPFPCCCMAALCAVLEGMDLVNRLQELPVDRGSRPLNRVVIADCGELA